MSANELVLSNWASRASRIVNFGHSSMTVHRFSPTMSLQGDVVEIQLKGLSRAGVTGGDRSDAALGISLRVDPRQLGQIHFDGKLGRAGGKRDGLR